MSSINKSQDRKNEALVNGEITASIVLVVDDDITGGLDGTGNFQLFAVVVGIVVVQNDIGTILEIDVRTDLAAAGAAGRLRAAGGF